MEIIKSLDNKKIKSLRKLKEKKYRDKEGLFLVEGIHLVLEAYKTNNLEEVNIWLQNRIFILDELNQQAKCNSTDNEDNEDWVIYNFEII